MGATNWRVNYLLVLEQFRGDFVWNNLEGNFFWKNLGGELSNVKSAPPGRWILGASLGRIIRAQFFLWYFFRMKIFDKEEIRKQEVFSGCHEISMNGNVRHREHQKERYGIVKNLWQQISIMVDLSIAQLYMIYVIITQNWYQIWHNEEYWVLTSLHVVYSLFRRGIPKEISIGIFIISAKLIYYFFSKSNLTYF